MSFAMLHRRAPAAVFPAPRVPLLCLFAAILFLACNALAQAAHAFGPSKSWKLLFVRAGDIWIANGDGTRQHLLIKNGDVPCWSPDKSKIAFERDSNIWVARADGTHQKPMTRQWKPLKSDAGDIAGVEEIGIAWDKNLAIFYSHGEAQSGSAAGTTLFTIPLRPLDERLILHLDYSSGPVFGFSEHAYPAVSRTGAYCAFVCNGDIWAASRDSGDPTTPGWNIHRLNAVADFDQGTNRGDAWTVGATHLSWSPDQNFLAYSLCRLTGTGQYEIHVLNIKADNDGRPAVVADRRLSGDGMDPVFSPDGNWIVYCGPTPGMGSDPRSIWIMRADGKSKRFLITDGTSPAW